MKCWTPSGTLVKVGIYATRGNELVIPTVYATIGVVLKGADPSGDTSTDPTLPIWAQLQAMIGDLADLDTDAKDNLVVAINEAVQIGSVSPEDVAQAVADYLTAHPIEETDPTVPAWAKATEKPTYTAAEVGAATEQYVDYAIREAGQAAFDTLNPMFDAKQDKGDYLTADALQAATDAALAQAKASGAFDGAPGKNGAPGKDGTDGITPTIGDNGNWYLGTTDTGKPARGPTGSPGPAYTLTAADKQTIVSDVLDALPTWSGGSY